MKQKRGRRRLGRLPRARVLDREVAVATGIRSRLLGLALLDRADAAGGLLIPRCRAVHTFGMRFSLDLYFLDRHGRVLDARMGVPPSRFEREPGAIAVLELPGRAG